MLRERGQRSQSPFVVWTGRNGAGTTIAN